ncbi:MAG: hypothetical protein LBO74_11940 [Candidatus Symbiothrix sp.]|jgi:hypothetical protein|nr:hypothetical protein [Candidatus Symbiothrix sp.]
MKSILKYKNRGIVCALLLSLSFNLSAGEIKSSFDLHKNEINSGYPNPFDKPLGTREASGGIDLGSDNPDENQALNPIGDAFPLLLSFGLAYGISVYKRKAKIFKFN